uniref:HTH_Tnp_Tc3_2 domain-containing protein n=1 Tax=Heterorhabditis bacteriophora TaxID=37862 RepID=A0A1I7XSG5_HETBA
MLSYPCRSASRWSKGKNITPNQQAMIKNWRARVALAREHLTWSTADWTKVVFSDQSKFNHSGPDGKKFMHRRPGEEFMPKCTIPTIKHGDGSVMVWAAFNRNGSGLLHIVEGTMDKVKGWIEIGYSNKITIQNSQVTPRNVGSIRRNHQNGVAVPESRFESHSTPMERCREGGTEAKAIQY